MIDLGIDLIHGVTQRRGHMDAEFVPHMGEGWPKESSMNASQEQRDTSPVGGQFVLGCSWQSRDDALL